MGNVLLTISVQGNAEWEVMNVTVRQMKFMEDGEYRAEVGLEERPLNRGKIILHKHI